MIRIINNAEDVSQKKHEEGERAFAFRLTKYLKISGLQDVLLGINVIFSITFIGLHAADTYNWPSDSLEVGEDSATFYILEMVLMIYMLADYAFNFYLDENKLLYAFSTSSLLDYISILPTFLTRVGAYQANQYILFTRAIRCLQVQKLEFILQRHSNDVGRVIFEVRKLLEKLL